VEVEAARSAAGRSLTEEDRDHLLSCLDRTTQAQPDHYRQVDSRLHLAIAEMSGSRLLVQAVTEAEVFVHDLLAATPLIPTKLQHSNQQHRLIVDAVVAGNPDAAQLYMADHLEATAAMLRGFFSQVEAPANPSERPRSKRATSPRVRRPQ
jgi:DNA-binding FadR family transcriptional regulator